MGPNYFLKILMMWWAVGGFAQTHEFSEGALADTLVTFQGETVTFKKILDDNAGKTIFIDVWATWCRDCIVGMPDVKNHAKNYPDVIFVYLSLDRTEAAWKNGIEKYRLSEGMHYWVPQGWETPLFSSIELDWIPRYMVVGPEGKIQLYRAIKANDKELRKKLKTLP